jgi:hypothetical protein
MYILRTRLGQWTITCSGVQKRVDTSAEGLGHVVACHQPRKKRHFRPASASLVGNLFRQQPPVVISLQLPARSPEFDHRSFCVHPRDIRLRHGIRNLPSSQLYLQNCIARPSSALESTSPWTLSRFRSCRRSNRIHVNSDHFCLRTLTLESITKHIGLAVPGYSTSEN